VSSAVPSSILDRTFEAVVFEWDCAGVRGGRASAAVRRRIEALCRAGVDVTIVGGTDLADVNRQLNARPDGPGRLMLCLRDGTEQYDVDVSGPTPLGRGGAAQAGPDGRPDPMRAILAWLAPRGIGAGLVLVVAERFGPTDAAAATGERPLPVAQTAGVYRVSIGSQPVDVPAGVRFLGGGPAMLLRVLDEQLDRRWHRRVPAADDDGAWTICETGRDPLRRRVTESLFTLGAGGFATRGAVEETPAGSVPLVLACGVYTGNGADQHLLPGPDWTGLSIDPPPGEDRRVLDLRGGLLWREEFGVQPPVRTVRFVSAVRPGVVAMRAEAATGRLRPGQPLRPSGSGTAASGTADLGRLDGRRWARVRAATPGSDDDPLGIVAVAADRVGRHDGVRTVERIATYAIERNRRPTPDDTVATLEAAAERGFDGLLSEHRAAWAARWDAVDVSIPADRAAERAVRFALFQLWCNADRRDDVAVGARGLSGTGYAGHVFWDADVFVLPAMVSMDPAVARAMIAYRLNRLPAAQDNARAAGFVGARFPWESAADGTDVTPTFGILGGERVPILTGRMEEHITADVAWAADHYSAWTGDRDLLAGPGRALLVQTARYWVSRCRLDDQGRAHIDGVIGPDEYHESVSDNAYTNVMARWNLRRAANLVDEAVDPGAQTRQWRELADRLVDGYDPATGRYEQFAGYFQLEPLLITEIAPPPVAVDVLIGRDRVTGSQLIKQADVLMLHHLVPDEVVAGSLGPNVDFYGPRTAHGSSLSPAVSAALLARAGRPDEALDLLRVALVLDLDDLTGTTATGLHLATLGGVWQAMLTGFAGVRVRDGVLHVDPALPTSWPQLGLRFRCLGRAVRLDITHDAVRIASDGRLRVRVTGNAPRTLTTAGVEYTFT
jgi:trehalose/maltose hydrolase-like predicted phosphorylase